MKFLILQVNPNPPNIQTWKKVDVRLKMKQLATTSDHHDHGWSSEPNNVRENSFASVHPATLLTMSIVNLRQVMKVQQERTIDSFPFYSEQCLIYLEQALEIAEASREDEDFRRFYQGPEDDSSSDNEEGEMREDSSSEDDINEGTKKDNYQTSGEPNHGSSQNPALSEKQKNDLMKQYGKPPSMDLELKKEHGLLRLPAALVTKEERASDRHTICKAYHDLAQSLNAKRVLVILLQSGRFAGGVFSGAKCLQHTTSTRYTVRKGQGKAQSAQDGKRRPKSVGSQLRRAGEEALRQDVQAALQRWNVPAVGLILLSCPRSMMKDFFHDNADLIPRNDTRIRRIPLDVGRPTFEAVMAAYEILMTASLVEKEEEPPPLLQEEVSLSVQESQQDPSKETNKAESNVIDTPSTTPLTRLHEVAAAANLAELIQLLSDDSGDINQRAGDDFMTPLHYAAASTADPTTAAACITSLLMQGRADPTIVDGRRRPAYFVAAHDKIRDAFRMARAILGEDFCDWDGAKVGPPLTQEDIEAKKNKAREKKRRQKERQKEQKAKDRTQQEELEEQKRLEEQRQKEEEDARRIRHGLQPKIDTATNVCDFCQKKCKGKRRSQMFQRLEYAYCSSECVQNHKRELLAQAALARFGS